MFTPFAVAARSHDRTDYADDAERDDGPDSMAGSLQSQIEFQRHLYGQLTHTLNELLQEKAISERVARKLRGEFESSQYDDSQKERYIHDVLPERAREWRRIKRLRDELAGTKGVQDLKDEHIEHFAALFDPQAFVELKWEDRKKLAEQTDALYHARLNSTKLLYAEIESELIGYKKEGILHRSKVSTWLQRIFTRNSNPAAITQYRKNVVRPNAERWRQVTAEFHHLNDALRKSDMPRGFRPVTLDEFLLKSYPQRTSYCALAWAQVEDAEGLHETDQLLAARKLAIRHALNTKDWDGAESVLAEAEKLKPYDAELQSMRAYLTCHREDSQDTTREQNPAQLMREMRETLSGIHSPQAQELAMQTLSLGPAAYNRFAQVYGNFGWCVEVANMSEDDLRRRSDLQHAAGAPGSMLDTRYTGTDSILSDIAAHADEGAGKTPPNLSADEHWGYWSTLIPDVPFALYREDRQKIQKLKYLLRSLHATGQRFSIAA